MLTINIPVYNIEVNDLARQLLEQAQELKIDFEIRIYDDGSADAIKIKNRELAKTPHVIYHELEQNLGRAAIRNKMGFDSLHKYLLFIDADSKVISERYLENYLKFVTPGCVLCGGTAYSPEKPARQEKILRWVYGRQREAVPAKERNGKKGFIITSNNFLMDREVFKKIHFREELGPYGHEDTMLGYDLFCAGINPIHVHNPLEHTGLEDSSVFLGKTRNALENLRYISEKIVDNRSVFCHRVKFLAEYNKITSWVPPFLLRWFFSLFRKVMEKNLTSKNPILCWFDVYKLGYFSMLKRKK